MKKTNRPNTFVMVSGDGQVDATVVQAGKRVGVGRVSTDECLGMRQSLLVEG